MPRWIEWYPDRDRRTGRTYVVVERSPGDDTPTTLDELLSLPGYADRRAAEKARSRPRQKRRRT